MEESRAPDPAGSFRNQAFETVYLARGERILGEIVSPALRLSRSYDRVTSFFSLDSLLAVAFGIETLWRRGGRMRLIIGLHAVSPDLVAAVHDHGRWPEEVLAELKSRLLAQISTLEDELSADRLRALAWMLREGLLTIRVGFPVDDSGRPTASGIFHPKKYLFTDPGGDRVAAVGSVNETVPGIGSNVEELTVLKSWEVGQTAIVERHFEIFETLWSGGLGGTRVTEVGREFGAQILERLGEGTYGAGTPPEVAGSLAMRVLFRALDSPVFALVSTGHAGFYPHQELAYLEALDRWPVRVLLADEVGLGKTLEAGAVLSYLLRFGGARRVLVLAPRSLTHQWQEELWFRFGIRAWRYESEERTFFDPEGNTRSIGINDSPVGDAAPEVAIVSSQLVRGRASQNDYFRPGERRPDVLVVDEAHHARIRAQSSGVDFQTRLWTVLDSVVHDVPHLILLTATPMQLDWTEFHATLKLLGLPSAWQDSAAYETSLSLLARGDRTPALDDVQAALDSMHCSVKEMKIPQVSLASGVGSEGTALLDLRRPATATEIIGARRSWKEIFPLYVRLHPGHLLTVRRTRPALSTLGYVFPERRLDAPRIDVPEAVSSFYHAVQAYLLRSYGAVEKAVMPDSPGGQGFARVTYYQRMASSLRAAKVSLTRRAAYLEAIERLCEAGQSTSQPRPVIPQDDDEEADDVPGRLLSMRPSDREVPAGLARIERTDITALLALLGRLTGGTIGSDPKLTKMCEIIRGRDRDERILVFSRYTDTVFACIEAFRAAFPPGECPGFAVYTGAERWADVGAGEQPTSKLGIRRMLNAGSVDVVFCSDAAAEGLNLQAARTVINVDVPWNPSKLEQRIGRVDRLGQSSPVVKVHNLWYPDSVEAVMYGRLAERHDLYQLAIGEAAEVIATEIHDQIAMTLFGDASALSRRDPLEQLQSIREQLQITAHQQVWSVEDARRPTSDLFRKSLLAFVGELLSADPNVKLERGEDVVRAQIPGRGTFTVDARAGSDDCITLDHPLVKEALALGGAARPRRSTAGQKTATLSTLSCDGRPLLFVLHAGSSVRVVPPIRLTSILAACATGSAISTDGLAKLELLGNGKPDPASAAKILDEVATWLPEHRLLHTKGTSGALDIPKQPRSDPAEWSLDPIGEITLSMNDAAGPDSRAPP